MLVDEAPYTVAVTGTDGTFSALVPAGADVRTIAQGRGNGLFLDDPPGAAPYGAYAAGPAPRPSRTSSTIERATMSRGARSTMVGA